MRHLGVELIVMHHANVHILGGRGQRTYGDAQADLELRKGDPRPLGGHCGQLSEQGLQVYEARPRH